MDLLSQAITAVQSFLWDGLLILLLCGTGLFFTIRLKGIQLRRFGSGLREMFSGFSLKGEKAGKHGMSSFQAVTTAIAGQVGTGNLAGAATAILLGGPGAIFGCGSPLFWEWPPFMRRPCWRRNSAAWTRMDRRWAAPRIISRRDCTANGWPACLRCCWCWRWGLWAIWSSPTPSPSRLRLRWAFPPGWEDWWWPCWQG